MPKLLIGINQNGVRSDNSLEIRVTSSEDRRGKGRTYVSHVAGREHGKPVSLPVQLGWQAARKERC
jgi:hypothetical protein